MSDLVAVLVDLLGDPVERSELFVPEREPYLSEWCRMHALHLAAIGVVDAGEDDAERSSFRAAVRLATAKDDVYYESLRSKRG